jgi:sugar phosphate isomerase/epimerase
MTLPIALQLFTIRDALEANLTHACKAVADIGYTHAEVGPFGGHTTEAVMKAAQDAGLTVIASHESGLMFDDDQAEQTVEMIRGLGLPYVVQPFQLDDKRSADDYQAVADRLVRLSGNGLTCLYHNHDFEFQPVDAGRHGWDILFANEQLHGEMDSCWVEVGGDSAVGWLDRLAGRIPLLHIKDCRDYAKRELCEVGTGRVPVREIVAAAPGAGVKYLVVEQDNNWAGGDPIASVRTSYENLLGLIG